MKEKEIHKAIAGLLDVVLKEPCRWLHVPNGGVMRVQHAVALKKMGQRAGFPDILIIHPDTPPHIFALEVKAPAGRMSPEQREWQKWFNSNYLEYEVVKSVDEVSELLDRWGLVR